MKKVKTKKKNGIAEPRIGYLDKPAKKEDKPSGSGEVSIGSKVKIKGNLKKVAAPKDGAAEGLAAKWVEKNQWIGQVRDFFREVRIELKKVTWPSRKETIAATTMVIILSILVALFLGLLDMGLAKAVSLILKRA
jgi:preprotein translocase subunit SecE